MMLCSYLLPLPGQKSKEEGNYIHDGGISATRKFLSYFGLSGLERIVNNVILVNYILVDRSSSSASNEKIFDYIARDSAGSKSMSIMIAALISFLIALEPDFSVYPYRPLVQEYIGGKTMSYVV
jgi:hypothetical protein